MEDSFLSIAGVVMLVGGFAAFAVWKKLHTLRAGRAMKGVSPAWTEAAEVLGGALGMPGEGPLPDQPLSLAATIDGVEVTATARTWTGEPVGGPEGSSAPSLHTVIEASSAAGPGIDFLLQVRGERGPLAVGKRNKRRGTFEERFTVETSNEDLASAWLSTELKKLLLATDGYVFQVDEGTVTGVIDGFEEDVRALITACRAVATIANRGARILAAWRVAAWELDGTLEGEEGALRVDEGSRIRAEVEGCEVEVTSFLRSPPRVISKRWLGTRVCAVGGASGGERFQVVRDHKCTPDDDLEPVHLDEELKVDYGALSSDPEATLRRLGGSVFEDILDLQPEALESDGRDITLTLAGLATVPAKISKAAHLAAKLASAAHKGPYR